MLTISGTSRSSRICSSASALPGMVGPPWSGRCSGEPWPRFQRRSGRSRRLSGLQVPVDEVDLLEPAKALADVLGADLAHALDRLQLGVGGGQQFVEPAELLDDLRDDELRQARDAPEDPEAARRDRVVQRVQLAVVAHQLGEAAEV